MWESVRDWLTGLYFMVFFLPRSFTRHKAIPEKTCEGFPTQPEVHESIVRHLPWRGINRQ